MFFLSFSRLLAVTVLFASTAPAFAYYKWTDENGVTHFSDGPPGPNGKPVRPNGTSVIQMRDNIRTQKTIEQIKRTRPNPSRVSPASTSPASTKSQWEKEQKRIERKRQQAVCQSYEDRIDWIDSRLRAGNYSVNYGNRLRGERRELSKKLAWDCMRG